MRHPVALWPVCVVTSVAVAFVLAVVSSGGAHAVVGVTTWGISPSGPDAADGRVSVRASIDPGSVYTDYVEVSNWSERAVTFSLAGSDGLLTEGGDFDVLPAGVTPTAAGAWIEIAPTVEIEAGSSAVVPFTVHVPEDALPGDHPAGIVASVAADDGADAVAFQGRTGVRLHLRVSGELQPALAPRQAEVVYEPSWNPFAPGQLQISWDLVNEGNVRLGATQVVDAAGPWGLLPGTVTAETVREVLPGGSRDYTVVVEAWPLFLLDVEIVAAPTIVGEDIIDVELTAERAAVQALAVPWSQLLLLLVLVLLTVGVPLWWRHRRRRRAAELETVRAEARKEAQQLIDAERSTDEVVAAP